MMISNEEEIRGKLLLPYLSDLGFDQSEISLETSFAIRLGKSEHTVRGRSDILCRRNGKNLFIIELKSDAVPITQKDIEQGISYARSLIDDIAPFVIITNGKETKILDSISKAELNGTEISSQSQFWKDGYRISNDEEIRIRYEALKNFVSFSGENLKVFCKRQVQDRMGPILGNIDEPTSKFIKDLYVQRQSLKSAFDGFTSSSTSFFAIVGSAGVGKTNAICSMALQCLEDDFVFFYNAAIINRSPLEHIAQDLNGVFSSKSDSDVVLKRLDELGRFLDKNIFIFIDAIDESINNNLPLELSELAFATRNLNKVKICISCKSNIWKNVLKVNDTPTHLYEELCKTHERITGLDSTPGFLLEDFNDEELRGIIPIYNNTFGLKGEIFDNLLKELRNGFFLRIFSEVYSHKQVPDKIDDKNLIKSYLMKSFGKSKIDFQSGMRILSKIGSALMNHKYTSRETFDDTGLDVEILLEKLNLSLNETLPEDLFARNILTKSNKEDSYNISFYYSRIRDYVISFNTYRLDRLGDTEFYNVLDEFYANYIGRSAIEFYLENACESHKHTLRKYKKEKALSYAEAYNSYLNQNFKNFKRQFVPKTDGDIGIVLPIDLLEKDGYALFPITSERPEKIRFENLSDAFSGDYWTSRMYEIGVYTVHGSNYSLLKRDQSRTIKKEIFKQLKDLIQKGRLSAFSSDILLLEQLALVVYYYQKELGYNYKLSDLYMPRFEQIYPLDLGDLQRRIYKFRAFEHFRRIVNKVPNSEIRILVEQAVENNLDIPKLEITGDFPPFEELSNIVILLQNRGFNSIERHHLPFPDQTVQEEKLRLQEKHIRDISDMRCHQYNAESGKVYIQHFFRHLESCYKLFVEELFPTFKNEMQFYKTMPHEYFFYLREGDYIKWGSFGYRTSNDGHTKFNFRGEVPMEQASKEDGISIFRGFSFDKLLRSDYHNEIRTFDKYNTSKVDDFCVLRNWVYKLLKDDLRDILKEYKAYI